VPEGNHPNANHRLYVDDKESYYRYDRLPTLSPLDEEPTGVQWNHPDEEHHRTTVWSGNGCLYIERVGSEVIVDRYGNVVGGHHAPAVAMSVPEPEIDFGPSANKRTYNPVGSVTDGFASYKGSTVYGDGCGGCGKNIS
jgi:hypothetical protein